MSLMHLIQPFQWLAGIILISLAVYVAQFRTERLARSLMIFFILTAVWCICAALLFEYPELQTKILVNRIKLLAAVFLPYSILLLALTFTDDKKINSKVTHLGMVIPIFIALVVLSPWHELVITNYGIVTLGGVEFLSFENGKLFFIHNLAARTFIIIALFLIYTRSKTAHIFHRKSAWLLVISILVPFLIDSAAVYFNQNLRYLQIVPLSLAFTALVNTYSLVFHGAISIIPFGRSEVVTSLRDPCLMWDRFGHLIDCNDSAIDLLAIPQDLKSAPAFDYLKENNMEVILANERIYRVRCENILNRKQKLIGSYSVLQDVTDIKKIQEQLEQVNQLKTNLVGVLGHDVHGHIAQMVYLAETLSIDKDKISKDQEKELIDGLYFLSKDLNLFMGDIVKWSKDQFEGWQIKNQKIPVRSMVETIERYMRSLANFKNIKLSNKIDSSLEIISDPKMLEIILRNLIYNAVKHSPIDSEIMIYADDDTLRIINIGRLSNVDNLNNYFKSTERGSEALGSEGLGYRICKEFAAHLPLTISFLQQQQSVVAQVTFNNRENL